MRLSFLLGASALLRVDRVDAHASMIMPWPRNAVDSLTKPWSGGKHPNTGWIEPYNCKCTNGTEDCDSGQSCFWFSQGCTIGCDACDGQGQRYPNWDHCPGTPKPPPTYLDKKYWTANFNATPGSYEDIFKFNPWRAPGHAPVSDACGMAGGTPVEVFNAGAYNATVYAKQGDLGTVVLQPRPTGTVWRRGGVAKTRWQQTAAHGGGYMYRLCPANEPLTEECFKRHPLEFATPHKHRAIFADSSKDHDINATYVSDGPAKGWMRLPLPNPTKLSCDYNVTAKQISAKKGAAASSSSISKHCNWTCAGCGAPHYAADQACPTVCSEQYPGLPPYGGSDPAVFPDPLPGHDFHQYAIEDTLKVPWYLPAGEYVLGWRWDCEMSSQVWSSCADITLV